MNQTTHRSHAESVTLPCRSCGEPVASDVWIIVETAERPDLLARLRAGTLHEVTCAHCGQSATINAPLLIVRPAAEPVLLFSPARGGDPMADEEQAAALAGMLRENLGDDWRDEWLAHGLTGVPREALPLLLGDDPATAAGLAAAHAVEDDVPPGLRRALEEIVLALAAEGVRIQTAEDLRQALESRPEMRARLTMKD
ncbi:MAG: hypothetical protein KA170_00415 [Candidatus Promineofilum sp.]|nr:hypothetical protein [Promineifilum sp.]